MKRQQEVSILKVRLLKAATFVLTGLLVVPGIDALVRVADAAGRPAEATAWVDAGFLARAPDAYAALGQLEELAQAQGGAPPDEFLREVGLLPGARDVRVGADGRVVGYLVDAEAPDALAILTDQLAQRGWTGVPLGDAYGATFMKQGGACTWMLATCTQVGSATSVVLRM